MWAANNEQLRTCKRKTLSCAYTSAKKAFLNGKVGKLIRLEGGGMCRLRNVKLLRRAPDSVAIEMMRRAQML